MKDRSSVVALVVILAICCLGAYVAVSGFWISQPPTSTLNPAGALASPVVTVLPTETSAALKPAIATPTMATTAIAVPSPLGAFQTITAIVTLAPPTPVVRATIPPAPVATPLPTAPPALACGNSPFCPRLGPPDPTLGPGSAECPPNYIFGRVVDATGKGIPDVRIRFRDPTGDGGTTSTKAPPDPAGAYNIPTGQPGSTWVVWVEIGGNPASPQVTVNTQRYPGAGNCPNRLDFVQR